MNKVIFFWFLVLCSFSTAAVGQSSSWQALNYQAVAVDEQGHPINDRTVWLKVHLFGKDNTAKPVYVESHKVNTDANGGFSIAIGRGTANDGQWQEVPWATTQVWMKVEMSTAENLPFSLISDKKLLAVPFAYHSLTANRLIETSANTDLEKSQSIYWNTGGNMGTSPLAHFIGTRDNKDLSFRSNNIIHMTLTTQGKLQLVPIIPAGLDTDKASYPMVVEGTKNTQGMWIKINGSRSTANNFMTFVDDKGIQGRIEGQTKSELTNSEVFITQTVLFAINETAALAEIPLLLMDATAKILALKWSALAAAAAYAKAAAITAKITKFTTAYGTWADQIIKKVGVTYSSGNGDYAEWLRREGGVRDLNFGEVVGVRSGSISLDTRQADHLMVVSNAPIAISNAPPSGQEDQFEKVAFMGQVPVRVAGPVSLNDYILPSGNNDGLAIAVHPQDMKTLDYGRILGVAWEAAPNFPLNIVNVAVGINSNDLAPRVGALAQKVEQIEAYLTKKALLGENSAAVAALNNSSLGSMETKRSKLMSDTEFDQYLDQHAAELSLIYDQVKAELKKQNIDYNTNPQLIELMGDPVKFTKKLRRNPAYNTQWGLIDQKIQLNK